MTASQKEDDRKLDCREQQLYAHYIFRESVTHIHILVQHRSIFEEQVSLSVFNINMVIGSGLGPW